MDIQHSIRICLFPQHSPGQLEDPHRGRGESGAQQNAVPATRIDQNKFSAAEGKFNELVFRVNRNQRLVSKRAGDQRVTLFQMPDMQPPF